MAIFISIKKSFEQKGLHYYIIQTNDFGGIQAFVALDAKEKKIRFFESGNFSHCIKVVNTQNKNESVGKLPGIPMAAYSKILIQALKALKKNEFPTSLDYYA